jgi:hypothetical protein
MAVPYMTYQAHPRFKAEVLRSDSLGLSMRKEIGNGKQCCRYADMQAQ